MAARHFAGSNVKVGFIHVPLLPEMVFDEKLALPLEETVKILRQIIEELSVKFKKNKITSIIGPNGSGKSTLLMLLSRIYKAKDGTITLNDKNVWDYKNQGIC